MRNFIGQDGFIWWIGVVEDIDDPLTLGRCKVRCFGYHAPKKMNLVPTSDLPWALAIHPLNTPNLYAHPNVGDWVIGFFLDGPAAQEPAIFGYLPAIPQAASEYFGSEPSLNRNFSDVSSASANNVKTVSWAYEGHKIEFKGASDDASSNTLTILHNTGTQIKIENTGKILITTNNDISMTSNNVYVDVEDVFSVNAKTIILNGSESVTMKDSVAEHTPTTIEDIVERLDNPTTAVVPNTAITVITSI